ncbi:MAG: prepilin-type N-terminal cleavage/methylation domain-containing protein [bacterium]
MAYQIRFNKIKGFSLLELLIVIAIFSIFVGMGTSTYYSMRAHTNLELSTGSLVEAVRFAESSAQSGKADSQWGVKILTNQIVIFKGSSYAGRDTSFDNVFDLSGGVSASGLSEIVFEKVSGATVNTGTIVLTNGTESKNLVVNEKGTVSY